MTSIEELIEYTYYESTELSEYWKALIQLSECSVIDDNVKRCVDQAIVDQLKWVKANTEWVEERVTTVQKYKTLKWNL